MKKIAKRLDPLQALLSKRTQIPPLVRNLILGCAAIPTAKILHTGIAKAVELTLHVFDLSNANPHNILGKSVGIVCIAGTAHWGLKFWHKVKASKAANKELLALGTSIAVISLSWVGTLSSCLIFVPDWGLSTIFIITLFPPTLISVVLIEPEYLWDGIIRGSDLRKSEQESAQDPDLITFGSRSTSKQEEALGCFIFGAPGSGKSLYQEMIMQPTLGKVGLVPDHHAIVFDPKPDQSAGIIPLLEERKIPYTITNVLDKRCVGILIGAEIHNEADAEEIAANIIAEDKDGSENKYFSQAARRLVTAIIYALHRAKGDDLEVRDITLACSNKGDAIKLLKQWHPRPESFDELFKDKKNQKDEVYTTIQKDILKLSLVAARWHNASEKKSISDLLTEEKVVVLGNDFRYPETTKIVNQLILNRSIPRLKGLEDDPNRRFYIFIDELPSIPYIPELPRMLSVARSKSICTFLATQDKESLDSVLGEKEANAIFGLCQSQVVMGVDPKTADFLSQYYNDYEYYEETQTFSVSYSRKDTTTTYGTQTKVANRRTVTAQELMAMNRPPTGPEHGLTAYFVGPNKGIHKHTYTWEEVQAMRIQRLDSAIAYDRVDDSDPTLTLQPWSAEEREALKLPE